MFGDISADRRMLSSGRILKKSMPNITINGTHDQARFSINMALIVEQDTRVCRFHVNFGLVLSGSVQ